MDIFKRILSYKLNNNNFISHYCVPGAIYLYSAYLWYQLLDFVRDREKYLKELEIKKIKIEELKREIDEWAQEDDDSQ